jgi:alginate O-acetyltransferase complex protein AlgJ
MNTKRNIWFSDYMLVAVFMLIICSAFVQQYAGFLSPLPNQENRKLSEKPVFNINLLDPYPAAYETYYNDHFAFRNHFVKWYASISFNWFKKSPYPEQVILGNKGQLYLVPNELDTYQAKILLSDEEMSKVRNEFTYRKKYCLDRGIEYYVVVCPTKYTVYPEHLPWYVIPSGDRSKTDQFIEIVRETGNPVIDLRSTFIHAKDSLGDQLFWPTDNHWSEVGAFIAYQEIMKHISKKFPELHTYQFRDFSIKPYTRNGGNLASILNMQEKIQDQRFKFNKLYPTLTSMIKPSPYPLPDKMDPNNYFLGFEMDSAELPRLLVVHDSFGKIIQPFLKDSFSRTVYIWDKWQYQLNEPIVEAEQPDVYITLIVESLIPGMIGHIHENK